MSSYSNFKRFSVNTLEAWFQFKVNVDSFYPAAKQMNEFWSDGDLRLSLASGCHVSAALILVAAEMAVVMIGNRCHKDEAISKISEREGFPENLSDMVQCYDAIVPFFDSFLWDVEVIE